MLHFAIGMAALFGACMVILLGDAGLVRSRPRCPLPWPWRLAWPLLDRVAPICAGAMTWRARRRWEAVLGRAGLAGRLAPGHMVAARGVGAALAAFSVATLALSLSDLSVMSASVLACTVSAGAVAACLPGAWLRTYTRERAARMQRALPFLLDMTTLCVEAGLDLHAALQQAATHGPQGPLREELLRALAEVRTGKSRRVALQEWSDRTGLPSVRAFVAALVQADAAGMNLGPILRAQAEQRRSERFLRAERLALEAPVKMLFPLIACIFPCTFIVLGFPVAVQIWEAMP
jgi:tight adherence protein C